MGSGGELRNLRGGGSVEFAEAVRLSIYQRELFIMSNNFWERDYVVQHLEAYPEDRYWLEQLSTRTLDELQDVVMFVRSTQKSS